jgi:hypothetical protein
MRIYWVLSAALLALSSLTPAVHAQSGTVQRPISDFLSQQGTYCVANPTPPPACLLFNPPSLNFLGWGDLPFDKCAAVDYAGLTNSTYGGIFGTETSGTVVERPLRDGRAEVTVTLHTAKALTFVVADCSDFANGQLLFGHRATDVLAGADAALADSFLEITFTNSAPGAPLPDFFQLYFFPSAEQHLHQGVFTAQAKGTLRSAFGVPDGTPGALTVTQTFSSARSNFQASVVNLRATGK